LIDEVTVTAGNVCDRDAIDTLLAPVAGAAVKPIVFGDSAYADGDTLARLEGQGFEVMARVPPAVNRRGRYSKDDFTLDLDAGSVACPAGHVVAIRWDDDGGGKAVFGDLCATCPLAQACTAAAGGRSIAIHPHEAILQAHKTEQASAEWQQSYTGTRPKVERKLGHFVAVLWGGRKARTRGVTRVTTDVETRAAAVNFSRLAVLGVHWDGNHWAATPT
jgi:hypothetical protein